MKYYKAMFLRWLDFGGRSSRAEYWYAVLYNFLFGLVIELFALPFIFDFALFYIVAESLASLYGVITFLPMLALTVRRLHDVGHTSLYIFISIIPIIGEILLLYALIQPSIFRAEMVEENYMNNTDDLYNQTYNQNKENDFEANGESQNTGTVNIEEKVKEDFEEEQEDEVIEVDESKVSISEVPKKTRVEQIRECQELLEKGEITKEEYDKRVKYILSH